MIKGKMLDKSVLFLLAVEEKKDADMLVREHNFLKVFDLRYKNVCLREEREYSPTVSLVEFK